MAFTVRTTATGDGNALASVELADAYFSERAIAGWTGTDEVKEASLIRATDYIDQRFSARYTEELLDEEDVPVRVARACCEYALRALTAALAPDPTIDASGASVVTVSSKLGPLEKKFQVVGNGVPALVRSYPAADMLLLPYLKPATARVIR
jgi:hypothetical protein